MKNEHEFKPVFGAIASPKDVRDYRLNSKVCCAQIFPEEFELEMGEVKNQMTVSSCVAHSLAEVVEYHEKRQFGTTEPMSTGFIYGNRENSVNKGEGMIMRDAIATVAESGDVPLIDFPYNIEVPDAITKLKEKIDELEDEAYQYRFSTYFRVYSVSDIKTALMNYGPVVFSIDWYDDAKVVNGVLTSSYDKELYSGRHCMVIYGWDEKGWKFQNSWGIFWGNGGRAILPYDYKINEAWGISDDITEKDIIKPYHGKIGRFFARALNFVITIFYTVKNWMKNNF